jgi:hypothetical protein
MLSRLTNQKFDVDYDLRPHSRIIIFISVSCQKTFEQTEELEKAREDLRPVGGKFGLAGSALQRTVWCH